MKRIAFFLLSAALTGILICTCERENQSMKASVLSNSQCKSTKSGEVTADTPDTLSCVSYVYDVNNKKLVLNHINAAFNCCPGRFSCSASVSGDTLIVIEEEENPLCNCDCLYDLEMEVTQVEAKEYIVKFVEPYATYEKKLIFGVDLAVNPEGSFCVVRRYYPWNKVVK